MAKKKPNDSQNPITPKQPEIVPTDPVHPITPKQPEIVPTDSPQNFTCEYCGDSFLQLGTLSLHKYNVHGVRGKKSKEIINAPLVKEEFTPDNSVVFNLGVKTKFSSKELSVIEDLINAGVGRSAEDILKKGLYTLAARHNTKFTEEKMAEQNPMEKLERLEKMDISDMETAAYKVKLLERIGNKAPSTETKKEENINPMATQMTQYATGIEEAQLRAMQGMAMRKMMAEIYGLGSTKEDTSTKKFEEELKTSTKKFEEELKRLRDDLFKKEQDEKFSKLFSELSAKIEQNKANQGTGIGDYLKIQSELDKNRAEIDKIRETGRAEVEKTKAELERERLESFKGELRRIEESFNVAKMETLGKTDEFSDSLKKKIQDEILNKIDIKQVLTGKEGKEGTSVVDFINALSAGPIGKGLSDLASAGATKLMEPKGNPGNTRNPNQPMSYRIVSPQEITSEQLARLSPEDQAKVKAAISESQPTSSTDQESPYGVGPSLFGTGEEQNT